MPFKEIANAESGSATLFGGEDLNQISRALNGTQVAGDPTINIIFDPLKLHDPTQTNTLSLDSAELSNNSTITFPAPSTTSDSVAYLGTKQTFSAKKTFTPSSTESGINVGSRSGAPSQPINGDMYYDSSATAVRVYQANSWTDIGSGGGGGISGVTIQNQGSTLSTDATALNFTGAGVVASGTGTTKTITIAGSSGSTATGIEETHLWETHSSSTMWGSYVHWHSTGRNSADGYFTSDTISYDTLYFVPFYLGKSTTLTRMGVWCMATNGALSRTNYGIYSNNTSGLLYPNSLITSSINNLNAGTGFRQSATLSQSLSAGLYWACINQYNNNYNESYYCDNDSNVLNVGWAQTSTASLTPISGYYESYTGNSLPSSAPTQMYPLYFNFNAIRAPKIFLKFD